MRSFVRKHPALFACLLGGLFGFVYFCLVYGVHTLDVTQDAWLLQGGDRTQHYLGWMFYRQSPWSFPPGMIEGIAYPYQVSVSYTDSIPLLAMFFKVLSPLLPQTFQYLGPFACASHVLVGGLGALVVWRFTRRVHLAALGGALLVLAPVLMQRTLGHTALGGQWLLLLPLVFWAWQSRWPRLWQRLFFWCVLLVLCAWIHPYFIPMAMVLQLAWAVNWIAFGQGGSLRARFGKAALCFGASAAAGLLALWLTGALAPGVAVQGGGLGEYSFNLNGFFNDIEDMSFLWPAWGQGPLQGEGNAYLGLGGMLLCGAAALLCILWLCKAARANGFGVAAKTAARAVPGWAWCAVGACALCVLLALGPVVMWGESVLFTIPYPQVYYRVMEIFRCTGRFIWPACYLLPLGAMWVLNRLGTKRLLAVLLATALCAQGLELSRAAAGRHASLQAQARGVFPYSDPGWDALAGTVEHIVLEEFDAEAEYDFAWYAAQNGLTINKTSFARALLAMEQTAPRYCMGILADGGLADTALICPAGSGWAVGLPLAVAGLYLYEFDGWAVILARELPGYGAMPSTGQGLADLDALHSLPTRLYLSEWREDGSLEIGHTGDVRGQSLPLPAGAYRVTFTGQGLQAAHCRVYSAWLGADLEATRYEDGQGWVLEFVLDSPLPDVEFWAENPAEVPACLFGINVEKIQG